MASENLAPVSGPAPSAPGHYTTRDYVDTGLSDKVDDTDLRLTNARTPTSHATTHASDGSDPVSPAAIGAATSVHTHGPATPAPHADTHGSGGNDPVTPAAIGAATSGHDHDVDYDPAGTAASAVSAHEGAANPHPVYLTQTEADALYPADTDPRLSDARTPTAHATSHGSGGTDPVTPADIGAAPSGHDHDLSYAQSGHVHDYEPSGTAASAVAAHEAAADPHPGYLTQTEGDARYPLGTDPRLSDARTPTAHAASHASGSSDPIAPEVIGAAPTVHNHAASAINSGTLALARIPTGTSGSTVALGDHDHPEIGAADGGYRTGLVPSDSLTPVVQHGLGTDDLIAVVREVSTGLVVAVAYETVDAAGVPSTDYIRFSFAAQPTAGQYRYVILSAAPASTATGEHNHAQAEVSGLVDAIAAKADIVHAHSAADVDSGTLALARIPTGTTSSTVALGSHTHGASTPTAHAASHASGGSDPISPSSIGAANDVHSHTVDTTPYPWYTFTSSATLILDAAIDNLFRGPISLNSTLNPPSNASDGQKIMIEIQALGAQRTLSLHSGIVKVTEKTFPMVIPQDKRLFLGMLRSGSVWYLLAAGLEP